MNAPNFLPHYDVHACQERGQASNGSPLVVTSRYAARKYPQLSAANGHGGVAASSSQIARPQMHDSSASSSPKMLDRIFGRTDVHDSQACMALDELLSPLAFDVLSTAMRSQGSLCCEPFGISVRLRRNFLRVFSTLDLAIIEALHTPHAAIRNRLSESAHLFFRLVTPVLRQTLENVRHQLWCMQKKATAPAPHSEYVHKDRLYQALWLSAKVVQQALEWSAISYQRPTTEMRALLVSCLTQEQFALNTPYLERHTLRRDIEECLVNSVLTLHLPVHYLRLMQIKDARAQIFAVAVGAKVESVLHVNKNGTRSGFGTSLPTATRQHLVDECKVYALLVRILPIAFHQVTVPHLHTPGTKGGISGKFGYHRNQVLKMQIGLNDHSIHTNAPGALQANVAFAPADIRPHCESGNTLRWLHIGTGANHAQPGMVSLLEEDAGKFTLGVIRYVLAENQDGYYLCVEVCYQNIAIKTLNATEGEWPYQISPTRTCVVSESDAGASLVVFSPTRCRDDDADPELPRELEEQVSGQTFRQIARVHSSPECVGVFYSKL